MKITLAGEEIEMKPTFNRIRKVEKECGVDSLFSLAINMRDGKVAFTDVVNIYWLFQEGAAYSQDVISEKILADGFANHLQQVGELLGSVLSGNGDKTGKK